MTVLLKTVSLHGREGRTLAFHPLAHDCDPECKLPISIVDYLSNCSILNRFQDAL